ncbi:hypothetical protein VSR01_37395 [Actinacidiphila sp. DG2A-62]|uniref:hypothetical protein n=1 Tax=Actinacidiphila sp. DG2A-62 TaxID=3108821 RepID=UPI002DB8594C|nr:hypothetical protein [Actinacidiphila sp. DG2A-62]MEC3998858.1 hypothetical protein [Actinacidiphila sp. DG2A-62]
MLSDLLGREPARVGDRCPDALGEVVGGGVGGDGQVAVVAQGFHVPGEEAVDDDDG